MPKTGPKMSKKCENMKIRVSQKCEMSKNIEIGQNPEMHQMCKDARRVPTPPDPKNPERVVATPISSRLVPRSLYKLKISLICKPHAEEINSQTGYLLPRKCENDHKKVTKKRGKKEFFTVVLA
jgi:hypothetical protein